MDEAKNCQAIFDSKPLNYRHLFDIRAKYFSSIWLMVQDAHYPEPVEGGRWGGFLEEKKSENGTLDYVKSLYYNGCDGKVHQDHWRKIS
jgi:hypothetical protein